ncbi:MAG: RluA family pseudouridine synthase [Halothiobacillaceae bacterium]
MLESSVSTDIRIVYSDHELLVVDKPTRLLSQPGVGIDKKDSLITRLNLIYPTARIVHRLDWETSGLMVIALNAASHRALSIQFQERQTAKTYIAVVHGHLATAQGSVDAPLAANWNDKPRQMVSPEGRPSLTHWRCLGFEGENSRVELKPVTGRSHQLRVHMLYIGHPMLGDGLYAPEGVFAAAPRLLLHAAELGFTHPTRGEWMLHTSEVPF